MFVTVFRPSTMLAEGETGDQKFDRRRSAVLSSVKPAALAGQAPIGYDFSPRGPFQVVARRFGALAGVCQTLRRTVGRSGQRLAWLGGYGLISCLPSSSYKTRLPKKGLGE